MGPHPGHRNEECFYRFYDFNPRMTLYMISEGSTGHGLAQQHDNTIISWRYRVCTGLMSQAERPAVVWRLRGEPYELMRAVIGNNCRRTA